MIVLNIRLTETFPNAWRSNNYALLEKARERERDRERERERGVKESEKETESK